MVVFQILTAQGKGSVSLKIELSSLRSPNCFLSFTRLADPFPLNNISLVKVTCKIKTVIFTNLSQFFKNIRECYLKTSGSFNERSQILFEYIDFSIVHVLEQHFQGSWIHIFQKHDGMFVWWPENEYVLLWES